MHLEQDVHDQDVEHVLQRVDYTVEHSLELGHSLDCLEGPQDPEDPEGLDGAQVGPCAAPPAKHGVHHEVVNNKFHTTRHSL